MYESLDLSASRYTIEVPITTYERELFNSSVTNTELIAEQVLEDILMDASKYFRSADPFGNTQINVSTHQMYLSQLKNGRMPNQLIKHYLSSDRNFADCIRYFTEKRYITGESKRKMVNGEQFRYYSIQRWDSLDETLTENDRDADSKQVLSGVASGGEDS